MEKTLKIKIIIIGGGVLLILCLILLFSGTNKSSSNAIDSYHSAKHNEAQAWQEADYWLNYDEKTAGSSTGTLVTEQMEEVKLDESTGLADNKTSLSDVTDDEDLLLMQTQQQIRNSNLENRQQTQTYPPVTNKTQGATTAPAANAYVQPTPAPSQRAIPAQPAEQSKQALTLSPENQEEPEVKSNRFYTGRRRTKKGNTISAAVQGEQTVMQGSTIKLRLLEDMTTEAGVTIPKGTTIWGVVSISSERLLVNISSVLLGKDLIPIQKTVYDIDGQKGINLPANVKAEIAKRAEAQSIQNAPTEEITSGGGILEKSAGAVVNTAKGLLSRKAEEIKVTVKSNYQIVLK
jgi:conjugative transposon TraM protein